MTDKLDVLRLTFYAAPVTTCVLLPFYYKLEAPRYAQYHAVARDSMYVGESVPLKGHNGLYRVRVSFQLRSPTNTASAQAVCTTRNCS